MIETKNIIDWIVNKFVNVINADFFKEKTKEFIRAEYIKRLEKSEVKFNMNFVSNNEKIDFLEDYAFDNLKFHTDQIGKDLKQELSRAIMAEENIKEIKTRIRKVFGDKKYTNRLKAVLRTEKQRAGSMGQMEGARQSGFKLKKYVSVIMDDKTSNICKAENRKYGSKDKAIPLDKEFVVKVAGKTYRDQQPPFHPNCRSSIEFVKIKEGKDD